MNRMQHYLKKLKKYCTDSSYRFVVNAALGLFTAERKETPVKGGAAK